MPSKSEKQMRTMRAVAHGFKPKKGSVRKIPIAVAKEYMRADMAKMHRRKTIAEGH